MRFFFCIYLLLLSLCSLPIPFYYLTRLVVVVVEVGWSLLIKVTRFSLIAVVVVVIASAPRVNINKYTTPYYVSILKTTYIWALCFDLFIFCYNLAVLLSLVCIFSFESIFEMMIIARGLNFLVRNCSVLNFFLSFLLLLLDLYAREKLSELGVSFTIAFFCGR